MKLLGIDRSLLASRRSSQILVHFIGSLTQPCPALFQCSHIDLGPIADHPVHGLNVLIRLGLGSAQNLTRLFPRRAQNLILLLRKLLLLSLCGLLQRRNLHAEAPDLILFRLCLTPSCFQLAHHLFKLDIVAFQQLLGLLDDLTGESQS